MKKHTTEDGRSIFVSEMPDQHLKNTVNVLINNAQAMKALIKGGAGPETITEIIHGVSRKQQIGVAREKVKSIYVNLAPYIMECMIRGIDFSKELADAFERDKSAINNALPLSLEIDRLICG